LASVVLGNGQPFDSCPMVLSERVAKIGRSNEAEAYRAACLKELSAWFPKTMGIRLVLTVVAETLGGRAHFGIVANVTALVASTTR